ncbi:MAG: RluA family pseudouridine synthase [Lentisphaeraceae bacterium]|nr:RluA family pseudouridine synthase [Lentisphaeraceae bacterium]
MIIKETHTVPEGVSNIRLCDYAREAFPIIPSRKGVKKAIKRGEILLNGEICNGALWVEPGQQLQLVDPQVTPPKDYKIELEVVFEDEHLAIINKGPGIEVSGNKFKTVENALAKNLKASSEKDALAWPRPVHRLDYPTSGLLLIAKTKKAQVNLGQQFEKKTIHKRYRAIIIGEIPESGDVKTAVNELKAHSEYKRVKSIDSLKSKKLTLVDLFPHTGRTHQLRVHMASLGTPILGDSLYGSDGMILRSKGLFLAAVELSFIHPFTKQEVNIEIPQPAKFDTYFEREIRRFKNFKSAENS